MLEREEVLIQVKMRLTLFKYLCIFNFCGVLSKPIGKNCIKPPNFGNLQPQLDICEGKYLQIARKRFEKNILEKF